MIKRVLEKPRPTRTPVRVLFIAHDSGLYGAQRCLLDVIRHLDRGQIEPWVVVPWEGDFTIELKKLGIPFFCKMIRHWVASGNNIGRSRATLLLNFFSNIRPRIWAICQLIEQYEIDVVYTNTITVLEGAIAARRTGRPHIWHVHELVKANRELKPLFPSSVIAIVVRMLSTRVIVNSRFTASGYSLDLRDPSVSLVYNGIDAEKQQNASISKMAYHDCVPYESGKARWVAIVGAIHPRKGVMCFLDAAAQIAEKHSDVNFLVIGDGSRSYVESTKLHARALGIANIVHFMGWRSDVPVLLAKCAALVVAAEQEPFGLTVVEAMALGVPVIATRSGGPEEIIEDGVTGYLVPIKSPGSIAHAAGLILSDDGLRRRLSESAQHAVRAHFSLDSYVTGVVRAICQVSILRT